jgi:bacillithiol biosynthesis deacetylase BshB1
VLIIPGPGDLKVSGSGNWPSDPPRDTRNPKPFWGTGIGVAFSVGGSADYGLGQRDPAYPPADFWQDTSLLLPGPVRGSRGLPDNPDGSSPVGPRCKSSNFADSIKNMKLDILGISVHPDDAELGCSGTLMMEKMKGKKIGVVDMTRGELGTRGNPELRAEESARASAIMQLEARENLGMADGFFEANEVNKRLLIAAIRKYRPEIILANALADRHPDHGRAGQLIRDACFLSGLRKVESFAENGTSQSHWRPRYVFHYIQDRYYDPSFVYDITPVFERKLESIRAYSSQFHSAEYDKEEPQTYISSPEFLNSVIGRHQMFGKMAGVAYAEGFITEKMIGLRDFNSLILEDT